MTAVEMLLFHLLNNLGDADSLIEGSAGSANVSGPCVCCVEVRKERAPP
jgi:hypothetical protein